MLLYYFFAVQHFVVSYLLKLVNESMILKIVNNHFLYFIFHWNLEDERFITSISWGLGNYSALNTISWNLAKTWSLLRPTGKHKQQVQFTSKLQYNQHLKLYCLYHTTDVREYQNCRMCDSWFMLLIWVRCVVVLVTL